MPLRIKIDRTSGVNQNIMHEYLICKTKDKKQELTRFLSYHKEERNDLLPNQKNKLKH